MNVRLSFTVYVLVPVVTMVCYLCFVELSSTSEVMRRFQPISAMLVRARVPLLSSALSNPQPSDGLFHHNVLSTPVQPKPLRFLFGDQFRGKEIQIAANLAALSSAPLSLFA
jgi:hypothetical protein